MKTLTLTPLQRAEADVAYLTDLHEGLKDGTRHWSDFCDSYGSGDRTTIAIEETGAAVRQARGHLAALRTTAASAGSRIPGPEDQYHASGRGPRLVTVASAAEMLGVSRSTAFGLIRDGELASVLLGPQIRRVDVADITALINRKKTTGQRLT